MACETYEDGKLVGLQTSMILNVQFGCYSSLGFRQYTLRKSHFVHLIEPPCMDLFYTMRHTSRLLS